MQHAAENQPVGNAGREFFGPDQPCVKAVIKGVDAGRVQSHGARHCRSTAASVKATKFEKVIRFCFAGTDEIMAW